MPDRLPPPPFPLPHHPGDHLPPGYRLQLQDHPPLTPQPDCLLLEPRQPPLFEQVVLIWVVGQQCQALSTYHDFTVVLSR